MLLTPQVHILGVGLAVHEKLVHPEMRPLHKKLVDQFHMMRTGLHHVSSHASFHCTKMKPDNQGNGCFYVATVCRQVFHCIHECACRPQLVVDDGVSCVNIQRSIWLGPSSVFPALIGLARQAVRGSTLPEASSPPTTTWVLRVCASCTDTGQSPELSSTWLCHFSELYLDITLHKCVQSASNV